jgi:hypothetical protein
MNRPGIGSHLVAAAQSVNLSLSVITAEVRASDRSAVAVDMRYHGDHSTTGTSADRARLSGSSQRCSGGVFCAAVTGEDRPRCRQPAAWDHLDAWGC